MDERLAITSYLEALLKVSSVLILIRLACLFLNSPVCLGILCFLFCFRAANFQSL